MARSQLGATHSPAGLLTSPGDGEGSRAAIPVLEMAVKSVISIPILILFFYQLNEVQQQGIIKIPVLRFLIFLPSRHLDYQVCL